MNHVPDYPQEITVYLVVNDFGKFGKAYVETDIAEADRETVIRNFISGQYSNALRVVAILVQYLGLQRGPPGSCRRAMGTAVLSGSTNSRRVAAHGQPMSIVLDLVHLRAGRRTGGEGGKAGFHESCGNFRARADIGPIAACFDQPQSSSCRGVENIELLETAKKLKIAALTTLMISRGVFSRDHILTPSQLVARD